MKTIIAEKPSVAREIARIVGATKREEGYFEGGGYAVTWAFGHLVQLAMPDGYGIRGFVRDNLPVILQRLLRRQHEQHRLPGVHIIVATPGRLIDLMERQTVSLAAVEN